MKRQKLWGLLISLFALGTFAGGSLAADEETPLIAKDYYVAPTGSDNASGSRETPFATLVRARDQIRADKAANINGKWTVHFAAGDYPVSETMTFQAIDSGSKNAPIVYRGDDSAPARLTGGVAITGWKAEGDLWVADLPQIDGRPIYFEQMFVNNARAVRARYPNEGFLTSATASETNPIDRGQNIYPETTDQFLTGQPGDLDPLASIPADELKYAQLIIHHKWDTTRRILLGFDQEKNTVILKGGPMKPHNVWDKESRYYFENFRAALDQPGEWFYDGKAQRVYYYPKEGETLEDSEFIVPRPQLSLLMKMEGEKPVYEPRVFEDGEEAPDDTLVKNIVFENMIFSHTDTPRQPQLIKAAGLDESITGPTDLPGPSQFNPQQAAFYTDAAININWGKGIVFKNCEISHIGEYAVRMINVTKCRIEHCEIFDLGAGGIRLGGGEAAEYNVIDNNYIHHGGRFHASAVAVWLGNNTLDNTVTHNDIYDFYYTGVSAGWNWGYAGNALRNRIEFNRIHKIGQNALADMGGVYTLGVSNGTRVCNNVIYDVKSFSYGGWGLYTDEGSSGITMENNLVYDTFDGSYHQHYGRGNLIRNNIFVDSNPNQVVITRIEDHLSITFENNIVVWAEGTGDGKNFRTAFTLTRDNLWWQTTGPAAFMNGKTHEDWVAEGFDVGGIVADPLFVDAAQKDFHLKPESPALKIGFLPFDYERAGLYGEDAWKNKAEK